MSSGGPLILSKGQLVEVIYDATTYTLTEHNRQPLDVSFERHENTRRTARANRRRYYIDDKSTFSVNWELIPGIAANTVDGELGFNGIKSMFETVTGEAVLRIHERDGSESDYNVHITGFNYELIYRYTQDHWYSCSLEFEEI